MFASQPHNLFIVQLFSDELRATVISVFNEDGTDFSKASIVERAQNSLSAKHGIRADNRVVSLAFKELAKDIEPRRFGVNASQAPWGTTAPAPFGTTGGITFTPTNRMDSYNMSVRFQSITAMPQFEGMSFEELRMQDYLSTVSGSAPTGGFGGGARMPVGGGSDSFTPTTGAPTPGIFSGAPTGALGGGETGTALAPVPSHGFSFSGSAPAAVTSPFGVGGAGTTSGFGGGFPPALVPPPVAATSPFGASGNVFSTGGVVAVAPPPTPFSGRLGTVPTGGFGASGTVAAAPPTGAYGQLPFGSSGIATTSPKNYTFGQNST